jgi:predicted component of type VI protein secretion system
VKARQNPIARTLSKIESRLQRIVEGPFARFSSEVEPAEIARKLEGAMEDGVLLQGAGRRLAPNYYDIYLSVQNFQHLEPTQRSLIEDWKSSLIKFAIQQRLFLQTDPVLRLHTDSSLRPGSLRIEAKVEDPKQLGTDGTQQLSPEQLAALRNQLDKAQIQQAPVAPTPAPVHPHPYPSQPSAANPGMNPVPVPVQVPVAGPPVAMPQAWLTISLPQAGQQRYLIEKPVVNIGRQRYNDIVVEDKRVSRDHAKIMFQNGQFVIIDLGSTNGITINGTPRMRQHLLNNGDRFTIGSYDFFFQRL